MGWDVMVGANEANRTLIGKALNREIDRGDWVHLGVAPKRDGLNSCCRRSVIAVEDPAEVTAEQRYWFGAGGGGLPGGPGRLRASGAEELPARAAGAGAGRLLRGRSSDEVSRRVGRPVQLERLKPYTGTHNAGYTECQEFYGAITLEIGRAAGPADRDDAGRGAARHRQPVGRRGAAGLDFVVVENTLGKFGTRVEEFNQVPRRVQPLVGKGSGSRLKVTRGRWPT